MRYVFSTVLFLLLLPLQASPALVPTPHSLELGSGHFSFSEKTRLVYQTRETSRAQENTLEPLAQVLASELELLTSYRPRIAAHEPSQPGDIVLAFDVTPKPFATDEDAEDHSYQLQITPDRITVTAPYYKGVAHGTATLLQTIRDGQAPALLIKDKPHAAYRGVMIDVARKPHSIEALKDVVRLARLYKMRYVHLHLTDDQSFTFPFEPVTSKLPKNNSYTREELLDLVAYANARGVTLIPELDLPGHSWMLRQANYLSPNKNHADVADPANTAKITAIIDDMLSVFSSSPYFHIGGDESGAGRKLIPFLERINKHLRSKPVGQRKRLLVWEGFHDAPLDQLPATGDDRVIVMAWESSYNPPWNLLENGYQIINSSWKPTYIVGQGGFHHMGNTGGRKWSPRTLYRWNKDRFMHWEPGRPVYNDAGPNDENRNDQEWTAPETRRHLILGGQMQFWEQHENAVLRLLPDRLAAAAERLWSTSEKPYLDFQSRLVKARENVMTIVQPIKVIYPPLTDPHTTVTDFYHPCPEGPITLQLVNRSKIPGEIRYTTSAFSNNFESIGFYPIPDVTHESTLFTDPVPKPTGFGVRARLFRKDGTPLEGTTYGYFHNWPNRMQVTDYDIGRFTPDKVIDLTTLPESKVLRRFQLPMLRGPIDHTRIKGQLILSHLTVPENGEFEISMETQNGTASLYLDLDANGRWDPADLLLADTPKSKKALRKKVTLEKGKRYRLRIDHMTQMPRPTLIATIQGPGIPKRTQLTPYLSQ